jgi:hypothetical protein
MAVWASGKKERVAGNEGSLNTWIVVFGGGDDLNDMAEEILSPSDYLSSRRI